VAGADRRGAVLQLGKQLLSPLPVHQVFKIFAGRMRLNRFGSVVCGRIEAALRELSLVEDDIALLQEPQSGIVSLAFLNFVMSTAPTA
jgi:hypothetical protein